MHLVCFRLRLHGRTPAAYDVRARDFAYESASYSFRALADRRLRAALSSLTMLVSRALAPRRTCFVPLLPFGPRLAEDERSEQTTANDIARSSLLRHLPLFRPICVALRDDQVRALLVNLPVYAPFRSVPRIPTSRRGKRLSAPTDAPSLL